MNMKTYFVSILLLLSGLQALQANDGVYYANGNQLVPIRETDISVQKEVLTISLCDDGYARVEVDYEFLNHGAAKTVQMGFEAENPYNTDDPMRKDGVHPYIHDFTVQMNGVVLPYRNAVVEPGQLDTPYTGPHDDTPEEFARYAYAYCFDAPFHEGVNKVRHTYRYRMSYGVGRCFEVPYWLKPAARWKGGRIGDFTLRIKAPGTAKHFLVVDSLFTGSEFKVTEGTGKVRHTRYGWCSFVEVALRDGTVEWHGLNYNPIEDLNIQSADTYISFDEKYPVGSFYDRSDLYVIWPMEAKVPDYLARNLPYASRGYVFKKKNLRELFSKFWWYMPDPAYVPSTDDFTPREWRLLNEGR